MARTDTLGHFLTDVADAIREKKGTSDTIQASDFDTEIENLPSGGGTDLSEYFYTEITENTTTSGNMQYKIFKKAPDVIVSNNVTSLQGAYYEIVFPKINIAPRLVFNSNVTNVTYLYAGCYGMKKIDATGMNTENITAMNRMFSVATGKDDILESIEFSENFDTRKVIRMDYMFAYRGILTRLNLSTFETPVLSNTNNMFTGCLNLVFIDMRNFDFSNISAPGSMFGSSSSNGPADNCEIIVADQTQKNWLNTNFSRLTNVKTVAEYEAEQSE